MHVLILSHHPLQAKFLQKGLRYENIGADMCLPENFHKIWYSQYDAVLIPLKSWILPSLPKILEIITPIKNVPVIILHQTEPPLHLSAILKNSPQFLLLGSHTPFVGIIQKIKQSKNQTFNSQAFLQIGDLFMDLEKKEVLRAGKLKHLRNKEFSLLECLMRNAGKTLTRTFLLENVWDRNTTILSNTVDVHINRLRNKIDCGAKQTLIKTVPMTGYKICHTLDNPKV